MRSCILTGTRLHGIPIVRKICEIVAVLCGNFRVPTRLDCVRVLGLAAPVDHEAKFLAELLSDIPSSAHTTHTAWWRQPAIFWLGLSLTESCRGQRNFRTSLASPFLNWLHAFFSCTRNVCSWKSWFIANIRASYRDIPVTHSSKFWACLRVSWRQCWVCWQPCHRRASCQANSSVHLPRAVRSPRHQALLKLQAPELLQPMYHVLRWMTACPSSSCS